jgi:iron(II)-dependent oxidoreductase
MSAKRPLAELEESQAHLLALVADIPDADLTHQYHPDLSPLAWHLGHAAFMEAFWIRETVLGDDRLTAPLADLFRPEASPKEHRGMRLTQWPNLREFAARLFGEHVTLIQQLSEREPQSDLLRHDYLVHFLTQHNQQHAETIMQVLQQRAAADRPAHDFTTPRAIAISPERHDLPAGEVWLGSGDGPEPYDNERQRHAHPVDAFEIAAHPVSNGEYLCFILEHGYERSELWSEEGWAWRSANAVSLPDSWRQPAPHRFHAIGPRGAEPLHGDDAATGLSFYEAEAFARFAGARLPTEPEWEYAARSVESFAASTGQAWEWCANAFYAYPGFRPFPYDGYSQPWFDGKHRALRGGSRYTANKLRRPGFRNFYLPDKRHIFAGVRLTFDK